MRGGEDREGWSQIGYAEQIRTGLVRACMGSDRVSKSLLSCAVPLGPKTDRNESHLLLLLHFDYIDGQADESIVFLIINNYST